MKLALGLEFPLAWRGGVSILVEELIKGLSSRYELVLVSPDEPDFQWPGVQTHVQWDRTKASRKASSALAARLSELGVQIAHFHFGGNYGWNCRIPGQSPFPFLKRRGIACVTTIHVILALTEGYCGPNKPLWFKWLSLPGAWLGKLDVLRNVKTEIVISRQGCANARRWYWPYRSRFQTVYHSRIDEAQPSPVLTREPFILGVGHIALRKGQHTLAEAFALIAPTHPEWRLLLIGPDPRDGCSARVEQVISAHKLAGRITLAGSRNDTIEFMRRAGIFVQPSLFEGLPLALQEAMYCGCPCVATDVVGNNELIDGETGVLVPPESPARLAEALDELIRHPERRKQLGRRGTAAIIEKKMTAQKMVERHVEIYESALATKTKAGPAPKGCLEAELKPRG
jgi:glycosyltransferase involved in cell wall biosynthesis